MLTTHLCVIDRTTLPATLAGREDQQTRKDKTMSSENAYPTIRLHRADYGYISRDGKYVVVRDICSDIGSSNPGCYKVCWHVHRESPNGEPIAKFLGSLAEARIEIACDMEKCPDQHLCRHGLDD